MITRFAIGFTLGAIIAFNMACTQSISLTGNHEPTQWLGIPIDDANAEAVLNYVNIHGAEALGRFDHEPYLGLVTDVTFVQNIFTCDAAKWGDAQCFGLTETRLNGTTYSTVALIRADYSEASTANAGCTALAHELTHSLSYAITGNPDVEHTNDALWAAGGEVDTAMAYFCPDWEFTPNNYNAPVVNPNAN